MNNNYITDSNRILSGFQIGYEFEFFSKFKNHNEVVKSLEKYLDKKVIIPYAFKDLRINPKLLPNHSDFKPDDKTFKLEKDYSGGFNMYELVTGPLQYEEAKIVLGKFLYWLKKFGYTSKKTGIHLNMSLVDYRQTNVPTDILNMNKLKFCLSFDEDKIYQIFPNRKNNVYASSIKNIYPLNPFIHKSNISTISYNNFLTPGTKYFGVNFLKQEKNYLEFRYIGGEAYEDKYKEIVQVLDHLGLELYRILSHQSYNENDRDILNKILSKHNKIVQGFSNLENFMYLFPNIKILVDLTGEYQTIKTFFNERLRDSLFNLIVFGEMSEGTVNLDTNNGRIQVYKGKLKNVIENNSLDFYLCKIDKGIFDNCRFAECEIEECLIDSCEFLPGNKVKNSKVKDSQIGLINKFNDCYIENKKISYSGNFDKCIIRYNKPTEISETSDCLFVQEEIENNT